MTTDDKTFQLSVITNRAEELGMEIGDRISGESDVKFKKLWLDFDLTADLIFIKLCTMPFSSKQALLGHQPDLAEGYYLEQFRSLAKTVSEELSSVQDCKALRGCCLMPIINLKQHLGQMDLLLDSLTTCKTTLPQCFSSPEDTLTNRCIIATYVEKLVLATAAIGEYMRNLRNVSKDTIDLCTDLDTSCAKMRADIGKSIRQLDFCYSAWAFIRTYEDLLKCPDANLLGSMPRCSEYCYSIPKYLLILRNAVRSIQDVEGTGKEVAE